MIQAVKVSLEVRSGAARFHVAIRAESIQRAVSTVAARYPGRDCRVKVPIDPEFFRGLRRYWSGVSRPRTAKRYSGVNRKEGLEHAPAGGE